MKYSLLSLSFAWRLISKAGKLSWFFSNDQMLFFKPDDNVSTWNNLIVVYQNDKRINLTILFLWYSFWIHHCMNSVFIRSFSGLYFPAFGLNRRDTPYSLQIRENTDQKNSKYEHFSGSALVRLYFVKRSLLKFFMFVNDSD